MIKKIAALLLAVLLLMAMTGCEGGQVQREYTAKNPLILIYSEANPEDSISGQIAADFKAKAEELSGGAIVIDVMYSGVLGSESDVLDGMAAGSGAVDIARISASVLTTYGSEKAALLSLPYTFRSREHFWNFAESDLAQEFLDDTDEIGLKGLFYGEEGFRSFFTATPVESLDDFRNMKIRVGNDAVMNGLVEALGAYPTVVSFGELYSALQTGVVDGAEQPVANYLSNSFFEVAGNLILDRHTLGLTEVVIPSRVWDSLTAEQQQILTQAGEYAQQRNRENSQAAEEEALQTLEEKGCHIVTVDDLTPWQQAVSDLVEENTAGYEDLYRQIEELDG